MVECCIFVQIYLLYNVMLCILLQYLYVCVCKSVYLDAY
jgi:hypothetical protein